VLRILEEAGYGPACVALLRVALTIRVTSNLSMESPQHFGDNPPPRAGCLKHGGRLPGEIDCIAYKALLNNLHSKSESMIDHTASSWLIADSALSSR